MRENANVVPIKELPVFRGISAHARCGVAKRATARRRQTNDERYRFDDMTKTCYAGRANSSVAHKLGSSWYGNSGPQENVCVPISRSITA